MSFRFYPLLSHLSFSKPLWIDWAIDDSMRSTYRTTKGANIVWSWWWKRPFLRLSVNVIEANLCYLLRFSMNKWYSSNFKCCKVSHWKWQNRLYYRPYEDNRWEFGIVEMSPKCLAAVQLELSPYHMRTSTRTFLHVQPTSHWTTRKPEEVYCGFFWWGRKNEKRKKILSTNILGTKREGNITIKILAVKFYFRNEKTRKYIISWRK